MTHAQLLNDLQTELWDFYRDVHGIRPRHWTTDEWASMEFLQAERAALFKVLDAMSPEEKIAEGWGSNAEFEFPDYSDDSDDGYALASAGWGTDEDYGSAEDML
jgi:hypothetical protein